MRYSILVFLLIVSVDVMAVSFTPKGLVTGYYTGWGGDGVRVTIEGADYSEAGCNVKDGYLTLESDNSGYKTHISALLAAYIAQKAVTLTIEGCIGGRPRIWGVSLN